MLPFPPSLIRINSISVAEAVSGLAHQISLFPLQFSD